MLTKKITMGDIGGLAVPGLIRGIGIRQVRITCGLILFSYLLSHFANHALGNISFAAMVVGLDRGGVSLLTGTGDRIEPDDGIVAIGSGGPYALAAAKALAHSTELDARAIAERAMAIAADICIYTNAHIVLEEL